MTANNPATPPPGEPVAPPPGEPAAPASSGTIGGVVWSVVSILLKLALALAILAVVGFTGLAWWIQQSYPAPKGVAAPVDWSSQTVVLGPEHQVVTGQLTIEAHLFPAEARVGLSVGAPSIRAASAAPGAVLAGPAVRLSATTSGTTISCLAPCALQLGPPACSAGSCRMATSMKLELDGDATLLSGPVTLQVAGGMSLPLDERLPDGLAVDLALEGATAPSAS